MSEPLAIIRLGMFCPVGLDAGQVAASLWAGVPHKHETSIMDKRFEPVVMGHLPLEVMPPLVEPLDDVKLGLTALQRRLLRLATPALQEVLGVVVAPDKKPGENEPRFSSSVLPHGLAPLPPLLVAGPQPSPGRAEILTGRQLGQLALQAGIPVDITTSRVFPTGHAGFFAALQHAQTQVIGPQRAEFAVIGGVDSYLDLYRLALLDQEERLLTFGVQDAFTPGEGAAFVLVASRNACQRYRLSPLGWIDAVGVAQEPGHRYSEQPYLGEGLAAAVGQVFQQLGEHAPPVRLVMAGFTGESMHAKEWGVAHVRNRKRFADPLQIEHSAEYTGDAGAGLAPMMLGAAVLGIQGKECEGPALVWASSEQALRGALVVRGA
jgi:3-oxoacyl-[acyl-carrier-protein] synthase-1